MRPEKNDKSLECELYIVHDEETKSLAVNLCNRLASICKCVHWDEKHYYDNEYKATNQNRFLFLSDKLISENLLPGLTTEEKLLDNVVLRYSGNMYGLKANIDSASLVTPVEFTVFLLHQGISLGLPLLYGKKLTIQKCTRIKLLFEGVKYLTEDDHYKLIIRD